MTSLTIRCVSRLASLRPSIFSNHTKTIPQLYNNNYRNRGICTGYVSSVPALPELEIEDSWDPEFIQAPEFELFTVKVHSLPRRLKEPDIAKIFADCNIVPNGIHLARNKDNRPSGSCFLEVASKVDVKNAKTKKKLKIDKREINVLNTSRDEKKWFHTNAKREWYANRGERHLETTDPETKGVSFVKLTAVSPDAKKEDIRELFRGLSIPRDGITITVNQHDVPCGIAYVGFTSEEDAEFALERRGAMLVNRNVSMYRCGAEDVRTWNVYHFMHKYKPGRNTAAKVEEKEEEKPQAKNKW